MATSDYQMTVRQNGNNQDRHVGSTVIDVFKSKVMGLTIMGRHLYVVHRESPELIHRYNLDAGNFELAMEPLVVPTMRYPRGLASSDTKKSIYVIDWCKYFGGRIWCVVMRDDGIIATKQKVDFETQPYGISVSPDMQILITCKNFCKIGKIVVFKQREDKTLFRTGEEYFLESAPNARQSIMNETGNCFVCYGWWSAEKHGLAKINSLVDNCASTLKITRFGRNRDKMNFPFSLVLYGNALLTLDHCKNRVLLFNQNLDFQKCILTEENGIKKPRQICIDDKTKKMFIGQQDGKILIFPTVLLNIH